MAGNACGSSNRIVAVAMGSADSAAGCHTLLAMGWLEILCRCTVGAHSVALYVKHVGHHQKAWGMHC